MSDEPGEATSCVQPYPSLSLAGRVAAANCLQFATQQNLEDALDHSRYGDQHCQPNNSAHDPPRESIKPSNTVATPLSASQTSLGISFRRRIASAILRMPVGVADRHLTLLIAMLKTGQPYGPKRRSATGAAPSGT